MSLAPMTAPSGIPPWLIPGASGGLFGSPGATPPFVGGSAPNNTYGTPMAIPSSAWPKPMQVMDKLGGLFGANSQGQGMLAGIDPAEARRRSLMAAGAAMLEASGPQAQRMNAGQIAARGMLAGQKANDEYVQDQGRQFYLNQLAQQQQMALEQQKRAQQLEQARARTMAGIQITPEALEEKAGELWATDPAGAEGLLEQAMKIRNYQVNKQNADTNASIAARGQNQYGFIEAPDGLYRTNPQTGEAEKVSSWAQFNPNVGSGGKGEQPLTAEEQRQKDVLGRRIADSIAFFSNQTGAVPALENAWDRTAGRLVGSEGYQERRNMDMIIKNQVLQMAKFLRPVSNDEVKFLLSTMPLESDPPDVQIRWLRQAAEVAGIQLPEEKAGNAYSKYGLIPPAGNTGRSKTGEW